VSIKKTPIGRRALRELNSVTLERRDNLMTRYRFLIAAIGLGLALSAAPGVALAASEHLQQAIQDTEKAARWAEDPHHDSSFVEAVDNALDGAIQAQKEEPSPHIKKGIALLRRAKKVAGGSHMRSFELRGAKIAKQALHEFQAVK
jgi:hypothetical protein